MARFDLSSHEDDLLEALFKSAVGGSYTSKHIEQVGDNGEPIRHVDTKEVSPNPAIAQYLLQILDKDRYSPIELGLKQQEIDIKKAVNGIF